VFLSSEGRTATVDAPDNVGVDGGKSGHVRVYKLDSSIKWMQVGNDTDGKAAYDYLAYSVSLSLLMVERSQAVTLAMYEFQMVMFQLN
jgi:hypothetical protein